MRCVSVRASIVVATMLLATFPSNAAMAQGVPLANDRGWVLASVGFAGQPDGPEECPNLCGPLGGTAVVAGAGIGIKLATRLAVVLEGALGPRLEGAQSLRSPVGNLEVSTTHRDRVLAGGIAVAITDPSLDVSARVVALAGVAQRRTSRIGVRRLVFPFGAVVPYDDSIENLAPALGAGVDIHVRLQRHLALVPSLRVHLVLDDDTLDNQPPTRGVSRVITSGAIGIAVRF